MWHAICNIFITQKILKGGIAVKNTTSSTEIFIDPVCLMKVTPGEKGIGLTYQMRTYYFCAENCRKAFEANPGKYIEAKASKRKGLWGRYLGRLNKVTGGKPPKCH